MYKLIKDSYSENICGILRLADSASIPLSQDNVDYIAYLAWCAEGNTPLPAEENT